MNKKGFTLVELLVVIVIISLISTIAVVSITRNRQVANEREKTTLKQTIVSAFENYRTRTAVDKDVTLLIDELSFSSKLSYNNNVCNYGESTIRYAVKEDKLDNIDLVEELTSEEKQLLKAKLDNSLEEVFCLYLTCDDVVVIDDSKTSETNEILTIDGTTKQVKVNYCR